MTAIEYPENGTGAVATFTAVDPEGESISWSLLEVLPSLPPEVDGTILTVSDLADFGDFSISANGVLTFKSAPDYETPADEGDNNEYNIVLVASDGGTATAAMKKLTIKVANVGESGNGDPVHVAAPGGSGHHSHAV